MAAFKAQAMSRRLKQQIPQIVAGTTIVESFDTDGFPILAVTKSAKTVFVKIETKGNGGRVDGLGLAQRAYSPHKVMILRENIGTTLEPTQWPMREAVLAECIKLGAEVQLWEMEAPTSFDLTTATLLITLPADPINKLTNGQ